MAVQALAILFGMLGLSQAVGSAVPRQAASYSNPILWQDLADPEVFRVNDTYYYSASTMHYSPGAPLLKSYDLVNWELIGHSVPSLPGSRFSLSGSDSASYIKGVWASSLGYRESTGLFYWYGCMQGEGQTHIYTATDPEGEWTHHPPIPRCYYDAGLLIDDDDNMYIAYGAVDIYVAQLTPDGLGEARVELAYTEEAARYIEGSRFYRIGGTYYIWLTKPGDEQHVLKSTSGPWGPYEIRQVIAQMPAPIEGAGAPHQGGLVDTPDGDWHYMGFIDVYPGGRIPVLAPIEWDEDGWPHVVTDAEGSWAFNYPMPIDTANTVDPLGPYVDRFEGETLNARWEWNHNPDNEYWSLGPDGLVLRTATVCEGLYGASNTLTQRIIGPKSQGTFHLDISGMIEGDQAGIAMLRQDSAYIGIHKQNGQARLVYVDELSMEDQASEWVTTSNGYIKAEGPIVESPDLWLQIRADITPSVLGEQAGAPREATFWYSLDGQVFTQLGLNFVLNNEWYFFMGYRFSVFNWAKRELGGQITVKEFSLEMLE